MITRIWSTAVSAARLDEYLAFAKNISLPMFQNLPGCDAVLMFRDGSNCHVLTLWRAQSDIDALATSACYQETVQRLLSSDFLEGEQVARTYDTHVSWINGSEEKRFALDRLSAEPNATQAPCYGILSKAGI